MMMMIRSPTTTAAAAPPVRLAAPGRALGRARPPPPPPTPPRPAGRWLWRGGALVVVAQAGRGRGGRGDKGRRGGRGRGRSPEPQKASAVVRPLLERLEAGEAVDPAHVTKVLQSAKALQGGAAATWEVYSAARTAGAALSPQTYGVVVATVGRGKGWDALPRAEAAYADFQSLKLPPDGHVVSAMLSALAAAGKDERAFELWEAAAAEGVELDTALLNVLLNVCARTRQASRALALYAAARRDGVALDEITVGTVVNALGREGRAAEAEAVYREAGAAQEGGVALNRFIVGALVAGFARAGLPQDALRIHQEGLASGVAADEITMNALINAFGRAGDAEAAWALYTEGRGAGLPLATNEVSVSSVLCAFAHTGEAARALAFVEQVQQDWPHGRLPPVCYLLLRDVAAAAGDVAVAEHAAALMRTMRHREGGGGDAAAPGGGGGGGGAATKDREGGDAATRRRRGVYAFATFACDGRVHRTENGAAEAMLPESAPERVLLTGAAESLVTDLRRRTDYDFDTNCILLMRGDDATKATALTQHAEKKALGALIRRSGDGRSTLRVGVNIRMCKDCHNAFKAASALYGRELVCDDTANVHVFADGICSCQDRWR